MGDILKAIKGLHGIFTIVFVTLSSILFIQMVLRMFGSKNVKKHHKNAEKGVKDGDDSHMKANKRMKNILEKYGLTENGFLPQKCLQRLPEEFDDWENIASNLPELNKKDELRDAIGQMKLLSCEDLKDKASLRRAYIILGMIIHSFVNGDKVPWELIGGKKRHDTKGEERFVYGASATGGEGQDEELRENDLLEIPKQLAVPWYVVCTKMDLPFVLTAALDLWNWRLKDPSESITLSNLLSLSSMTGTNAEMYFHMVPCAMQAVAGSVAPKIIILYDYLSANVGIGISTADVRNSGDVCGTDEENSRNATAKVLEMLNDVKNVFKDFKEIISRIKDLVDKDTFYDVYRPLLGGFWPDGILLDVGIRNEDGQKLFGTDEQRAVLSLDGWVAGDGRCDMESLMNQTAGRTSNLSKAAEKGKNDPANGLDDAKGNHCDSIQQERQSLENDGNCEAEAVKKADLINTACQSVIKKHLSNGKLLVNPKGPSAGQSTMIFLFDLLLGIQHKGSGKEFQDEMLNYLPLQHRKMVLDLRDLVAKQGSLRDFAIGHKVNIKLVAAYNSCVMSVAEFRALHLGIALRYLVRTQKGTGSSSFRHMLDEMVASTKNAMLQ